MIDFRSHVLPDMDDGATDVEMSVAMLAMEKRQGVDTVIATPHFYMGEDSVRSFLERRSRRYEQLQPCLNDDLPQLRLGAEVLAWQGMSETDLRPLCMEDTDLLLVEFPFATMPYWLVEELEKIIVEQRLTLILAHLERYMPFYSQRDVQALCELPDVIQLNSQSLTGGLALRRLGKWLPAVERVVLGTDMHNLTDRAPCMDKAMRTLSHGRTGNRWKICIEQTSDILLNEQAEEDWLFL